MDRETFPDSETQIYPKNRVLKTDAAAENGYFGFHSAVFSAPCKFSEEKLQKNCLEFDVIFGIIIIRHTRMCHFAVQKRFFLSAHIYRKKSNTGKAGFL